MNIETRTFILGLIMLFTGGACTVLHLIRLDSGVIYGWFDWTLFIGCVLIVLSGIVKVSKTTD